MGGDDPFPGADLGRPVTVHGTWLGDDTVFVQDRHLDGRTGYWVVTPVQVGTGTGGSAMPVVRGWSTRPRAAPVSGAVSGFLVLFLRAIRPPPPR